MDISSLKDLKTLIALCRKQGIEFFKIDGIEFKLSAVPPPKKLSRKELNEASKIINENTFTPDDILNWSAPNVFQEPRMDS